MVPEHLIHNRLLSTPTTQDEIENFNLIHKQNLLITLFYSIELVNLLKFKH